MFHVVFLPSRRYSVPSAGLQIRWGEGGGRYWVRLSITRPKPTVEYSALQMIFPGLRRYSRGQHIGKVYTRHEPAMLDIDLYHNLGKVVLT